MLRAYIREVLATTRPLVLESDGEGEMTDALLKWLMKRTKKAKGIVQMNVVEDAFDLMEGWSIEPITTFLLLNGNYDLQEPFVKHGVAEKIGSKHYGKALSTKEPVEFHFDSEESAKAAISAYTSLVDATYSPKKKTPPTEAEVGKLYSSEPRIGKGKWGGSGVVLAVDRIWVGVPGWRITAPNGKSIELPHPMNRRGKPQDPNRLEKFAKFWTWTYKNGLAESAKQALEAHDPEAVELAGATAAERKKAQMRRIILPEVNDILREIVNDKFEEVWDHLTQSHMKALEFYLKAAMKDGKKQSLYSVKKENPWLTYYSEFLQRAVDDDFYDKTTPPKAKPDAKKIARSTAKYMAEGIREEFVLKNGYKLSLIIREKGNLKDSKLLRINAGDDFGGEIRFTFEDGSAFTVRNKTVFKVSQLGKWFEQYPTTFHDVVMPDGKKMRQPSEKRMVDVFAAV